MLVAWILYRSPLTSRQYTHTQHDRYVGREEYQVYEILFPAPYAIILRHLFVDDLLEITSATMRSCDSRDTQKLKVGSA